MRTQVAITGAGPAGFRAAAAGPRDCKHHTRAAQRRICAEPHPRRLDRARDSRSARPRRRRGTAPIASRRTAALTTRSRQAELEYVARSAAAQTALAENYVGLPY